MGELAGKRILFTRPLDRGQPLAALLGKYGAELVAYPVLEIKPVTGPEREAAVRAVRALSRGAYDGVLLTSANAVIELAAIAAELDTALTPSQAHYFAIGTKTASALAGLGLRACVAERAAAEGVLATVLQTVGDVRARSFLFPRARHGRAALAAGLRDAGARVDVRVVYDTAPLDPLPPLPVDIHWVTFMSPSAVRAFLRQRSVPVLARVACIGSTTARAAESAGLRVAVVAPAQTIEAMVAAMADYETEHG